MTQHDHVVSPETARKLVDAGADCTSMLVWFKTILGDWQIMPRGILCPGDELLPAWVATELMEWHGQRSEYSVLDYGKPNSNPAEDAAFFASPPGDFGKTYADENSAEAVAALILEGHEG